MLLKSVVVVASVACSIVSALPAVDLVSSTESTEFGAYVNPNPKNICEGEELETLTVCASEVLSKLDECKPDDLACECCALQSMKRDCYGLCPNTASGNFLAVLYDDCETMNDVNACNLPFKKHDTHIAKFLKPNSRIPVEEKEPDFVIKSVLVIANVSNSTNASVTGFPEDSTIKNEKSNGTNVTSFNSSYYNATQEENKAAFIGDGTYLYYSLYYFALLMALLAGWL